MRTTPVEYTFLISLQQPYSQLTISGICKRDKRYNPTLIISANFIFIIVNHYES